MLALTDRAVEAVRDIVASSHERLGDRRAAPDRRAEGTQASFKLRVVQLPAEDDEVIEEQGARVFVEPEAATLLADKAARRERRPGPGRVRGHRPAGGWSQKHESGEIGRCVRPISPRRRFPGLVIRPRPDQCLLCLLLRSPRICVRISPPGHFDEWTLA